MKEMKIERKEKWIRINTIEGYEDVKDYYYLSNSDEDKIINKDTGKTKKIGLNKDGYPKVGLMTIEGKVMNYNVHILKAKAFLYTPNPLTYSVIRHLNDIKTDNRLENLAFGTLSDNVQDCIRNGNYNYEASIKNFTKGYAKGGAITGAKNGRKGAKKTSKPVICIEIGIVYSSTKEAERQTGIHNGSIGHCCRGEYKTAGGFHWAYVNKEVNNNELECKQIR